MIREHLKQAINDALAKGWSGNQLAKAAGVDQGGLSRLMNDQRGVSVETADKLAAFFSMKLTQPKIPPANKG